MRTAALLRDGAVHLDLTAQHPLHVHGRFNQNAHHVNPPLAVNEGRVVDADDMGVHLHNSSPRVIADAGPHRQLSIAGTGPHG